MTCKNTARRAAQFLKTGRPPVLVFATQTPENQPPTSTQNRPKIDPKSVPRAFDVKVIFLHPSNIIRRHPKALLDKIFRTDGSNLASKLTPSWAPFRHSLVHVAFKCGFKGVQMLLMSLSPDFKCGLKSKESHNFELGVM